MSALRWRLRGGGVRRRRPGTGPATGRGARGSIRARDPRLARLRWRPGPRVLLAMLALVLGLGGGFLWLRTSSLVAVHKVAITGVSGPDAGRIEAALRRAALTMTTLDVKLAQLDTVVAPYPVVKSLEVSTQFPHGMRIVVHEALPVGVISAGGVTIAVAGDGTLLHSSSGAGALPVIALRALPGGTRVSDPTAQAIVALLAAAPWQLRTRLSQAQSVPGHGLEAQLRNGPQIIFGDGGQLAAKWASAAAVLASPDSAGAEYIDVSDPRRPAAGAAVGGSSTTSSATSSAASPTPGATAGTVSTAAPAATAAGTPTPAPTTPTTAAATATPGG